MLDFKTVSKDYSRQTDNFSCGLFVYNSIKSILDFGNADQLSQLSIIHVSLEAENLSLENEMTINFRIIHDAREVTESGESFPWDVISFNKVLRPHYEIELKRIIDEVVVMEDENEQHVANNVVLDFLEKYLLQRLLLK
ncbi:MAG: hypothetical protein REH83_06210 [Rickettsiella sp.]|nr:hypothetical protein [Rickettsiella sp.]